MTWWIYGLEALSNTWLGDKNLHLRSPIQESTTFDVASLRYLAIKTVPSARPLTMIKKKLLHLVDDFELPFIISEHWSFVLQKCSYFHRSNHYHLGEGGRCVTVVYQLAKGLCIIKWHIPTWGECKNELIQQRYNIKCNQMVLFHNITLYVTFTRFRLNTDWSVSNIDANVARPFYVFNKLFWKLIFHFYDNSLFNLVQSNNAK